MSTRSRVALLMLSLALALPIAARCDRPKGASDKEFNVKVGILAQGPDEKRGLAGRDAGCLIAINATLSDNRPSLGRGVPPTSL